MSSTARVRACRERAARGEIVVPVVVSVDVLDELVAGGFLEHSWDSEDRTKVARAIERVLAALMKPVT